MEILRVIAEKIAMIAALCEGTLVQVKLTA